MPVADSGGDLVDARNSQYLWAPKLLKRKKLFVFKIISDLDRPGRIITSGHMQPQSANCVCIFMIRPIVCENHYNSATTVNMSTSTLTHSLFALLAWRPGLAVTALRTSTKLPYVGTG